MEPVYTSRRRGEAEKAEEKEEEEEEEEEHEEERAEEEEEEEEENGEDGEDGEDEEEEKEEEEEAAEEEEDTKQWGLLNMVTYFKLLNTSPALGYFGPIGWGSRNSEKCARASAQIDGRRS